MTAALWTLAAWIFAAMGVVSLTVIACGAIGARPSRAGRPHPNHKPTTHRKARR